jgi:hypothetical protein
MYAPFMHKEAEQNKKVTLQLYKNTFANFSVKKCRCGIPKFRPYPTEIHGSADDSLKHVLLHEILVTRILHNSDPSICSKGPIKLYWYLET